MDRGEIGLFKQLLEVIFNCTHDAISIIAVDDEDFRFIRNNTTHKRISGDYNIEGKTLEEVVGNVDGNLLRTYIKQCISSRKPLDYETEVEFPSGRCAWFTNLTPVFHRSKILYIVASSKDVTEMKATRCEKNDISNDIIAMFNQHNAVMLLIEPMTGQIVEANAAACEFYGYTKEELLKLFMFDLNILNVVELKRQLEVATNKEQKYFVSPHRTKDGTIHLVDVYSCPVTVGNRTLLFFTIFDVSDREEYRKRLYSEKELLRTTLSSIGDGVVTTDLDGHIIDLNEAAQNMTGWSKSEAIGKHFGEVFIINNETTGELFEYPIHKVMKTERVVGLASHTVLVNRKGKKIPIADSAAPIKGVEGQTLGAVMVLRDISKEKKDSDRILYISYHDFLTDLYNRRFIEEYIEKAENSDHLPISVIVGDINGLKLTNDIFGHNTGDKLLIKAAKVIKKCCPRDSIAARWGGDEFIILLPHTEIMVAEAIVKKIRATCEQEENCMVKVSLSLGYATKENSEIKVREVIRKAEEYMYRHKLLDGKSYHNALIHTLLATLYEKSIETEEHTKRLGDLSYAFGLKLGLHSRELDEISLLALLHDIGKVGIRQSILKKSGKLTDDEWDEMKQHPAIGYRIAKSTPELTGVADYILYHHEHWDGTGYPQGLKGNEIPLNCRVLALADAYDAMTSDRVYRKAMTQREAITELRENAGTQFDPQLVEPFIKTVLSIEILNAL